MSPNFYNQKLGVSPIHVAANEGESEKVDILVKNKAEVNVVNAEGLAGMLTSNAISIISKKKVVLPENISQVYQ